jgi:hypothetical protein
VCGRVFARSRPNEAGQQIQDGDLSIPTVKMLRQTLPTLTLVSRLVCEQIPDKAVLSPLRSILGLLHGDPVYL